MGEMTEERTHVIKELTWIDDTLSRTQKILEDEENLRKYTKKDCEKRINELIEVFNRSQELAAYMNGVNNGAGSTVPPFNIFQGDLTLVRHGIPNLEIASVRYVFTFIMHGSFYENHYKNSLVQMDFALNCFRTFKRIAEGKYKIETFKLKDVLDKVLKYRDRHYHGRVLGEEKKFVLNEHIGDIKVTFDKDALYWIAMRMLSNAEHAIIGVDNAWIRIQTFRHNDGNVYLIVRNNGMTIAQREAESQKRQGGRSRPNIEKLCRDLDSEFRLKGFPDHTRACLRLPLAESKK